MVEQKQITLVTEVARKLAESRRAYDSMIKDLIGSNALALHSKIIAERTKLEKASMTLIKSPLLEIYRKSESSPFFRDIVGWVPPWADAKSWQRF